jgi:hypothetical protein
MKYFYLFFCVTSILYGIYLFSLHLFLGDLLFHTDIARDFLLIQDIVVNHKLTLIGPRAGGIPGTFFGPIWLYLNLPAFLIGNGNPLIIGYFWLLLFFFGLGIVFYVGQKVFNVAVGIISISMYIYTIIFMAPGYTQSFAPVVLSPVLLYTVYLFVEKKRLLYLCWAVFLCGLLIQFQPAFGSIVSVITFLFSIGFLIKRKQLKYLLTWFIIFIPLATYVVFELRHNFLETKVVYNFIFHHNSQAFFQITFSQIVQNRLGAFLDSLNVININNIWVNTFFVLLNIFIFSIWYKSKKSGQRTFVLLIYIYIIGFWLITFLFKGTVSDYYYWGLYPLLAIALASLFLKINKGIFLILFTVLTLVLVKNGYNTFKSWQDNIYAKDTSSWIVNKEVADYVYGDANQNFGYYVYSPDRLGYSKKYAMSYVGKTGGYKFSGTLCAKEPLTYLIYEPTGAGSHTNPVFWKVRRAAISTKPISVKMIQKVKIEKYFLSPKDLQTPSSPGIICNLDWR